MRARALIGCALLATGCDDLLQLQSIQPPPSLGNYMYRKPITVTEAGDQLDDFVVLVSIQADADLAAHAKPDGSDITFGDTMTEYASEPLSYGADGTLQIWVHVPTLPPGPTSFFMYYGGPPRTDMVLATWAGKYVSAWHLDDSGPFTHDSGMFAHDANEMYATAPASVPGIAGAARDFATSPVGQPMCALSTDFDFGTSSFAYSAWIYVTHAPAMIEAPMQKGGSSKGSPGFDFELTASSIGISLADMTQNPQITVGAGNLPLNRWTLIAASVDREIAMVHTYVDGVAELSASIANLGSLSDATKPLCLGGEPDGSFPYIGFLDEVRVIGKNLSADWFHLEYEMLVSPSNVLAIGPETRVR